MNKIMSSVPQDLLPSIGLITVNYRTLEIHLHIAIWKLLGAEKEQSVGAIVTADLTFSKLINLIGSLHNELCDDLETRNEFQKLIIEIKDISAKRNNIIHAISGTGKEGTALLLSAKMRSPKGIKTKISHISKEELDEIADLIFKLTYKLVTFVLNKKFPTFKGV